MTFSSFFSALWHSFYSRSFYQEVGQRWEGLGIRYLFLLLLVAWIPFILVLMSRLSALDVSPYEPNEAETREAENTIDMNTMLRIIITQLPEIIIDNGEAHMQETQPYRILDPVTSKALMVIDTTGKINSLQGTEALILMTKRDVYVRSHSLGEIHYTLEDLIGKDRVLLNSSSARKWLESAKDFMQWILPLVFFPITVGISFFYSMFGALCYAAIGLGISKILKTQLVFTDIFRLAVVTRTPVIFFEILSLISPPVLLASYTNFIFFGLSLGYLFFAISANQPKEVV